MVNCVVSGMAIHGVNCMANHKAKAIHKPPARVRYEKGHPTVSCRLDKDTHDLLKQRLEDLGGVSFADFVKDALGIQQAKMPDIEEIKEQAYNEAYDQAKKNYQIWYYCAECRERINVEPDSDSHKAMIGFMKEHGWAHANCHRQ
ncbi:unnamed protein product [marine sediment metagenome]|uniref:Uncharacterized protein n=1 Tax=marine sediment metagenome TaxID=412755 RepID=X1THK8_9ZZZZ